MTKNQLKECILEASMEGDDTDREHYAERLEAATKDNTRYYVVLEGVNGKTVDCITDEKHFAESYQATYGGEIARGI